MNLSPTKTASPARPFQRAVLSPWLTGALALGAGLVAPLTAQATPVVSVSNLILTNINQTLTTAGTLNIDLDGNGTSDFGVFLSFKGATSTADILAYVTTTGVALTPSTGWLRQFAAGSVIDSTMFGTEHQGALWDDESPGGAWSSVGAHGFVGLMLNNNTGAHYGFIEVTRGSVTVGQMGYQAAAGLSATIPAATPSSVPEPSTALLVLASGAGGLAAMRRRRREAAALAASLAH